MTELTDPRAWDQEYRRLYLFYRVIGLRPATAREMMRKYMPRLVTYAGG